MPQDRDILFIVWRRKHEFARQCYSPANKRHTFDAVKQWKRTLCRCQLWYFAILLREKSYTSEELQDKLKPFLSQDGGRQLFAPTMLAEGKKIVSGENLARMHVSKQASLVIKHAAERDLADLEAHARADGSKFVATFIDTVKQFFLQNNSASSRSPFVPMDVPVLPEIKWPVTTTCREVLRKNCGSDDSSSQEDWVADILEKRALFVSTEKTKNFSREFAEHMQKRAASMHPRTTRERSSLLASYSRFQLCGILIAYFSFSKEPLGDRMLNSFLNKQGLARIAAEVLVIDCSTHLQTLHIRDFLTKEELTAYEQHKAASGEAVKQQRDVLDSYRENERYTLRVFWNKRAHGAARRQLKTNRPPQDAVNELACLFEETMRKQLGRCVYCFATLRTAKGKAWNNASPDRRVSAKRGGTYTMGNVDIVCVGCQFCKWWYTPTEFQVLLLGLAKARWSVEGAKLQTATPKKLLCITKIDEELHAGPWCKKTLSAMQTRKDTDLDMSDLLTLLQEKWVGQGWVMDESGVVAPLETMSIDRIISSSGYKKGNVRLLLWGLNSLKGDDVDDLNVINYLQHLKDNQEALQAVVDSLPEDERKFPHQGSQFDQI